MFLLDSSPLPCASCCVHAWSVCASIFFYEEHHILMHGMLSRASWARGFICVSSIAALWLCACVTADLIEALL